MFLIGSRLGRGLTLPNWVIRQLIWIFAPKSTNRISRDALLVWPTEYQIQFVLQLNRKILRSLYYDFSDFWRENSNKKVLIRILEHFVENNPWHHRTFSSCHQFCYLLELCKKIMLIYLHVDFFFIEFFVSTVVC